MRILCSVKKKQGKCVRVTNPNGLSSLRGLAGKMDPVLQPDV